VVSTPNVTCSGILPSKGSILEEAGMNNSHPEQRYRLITHSVLHVAARRLPTVTGQ
jgi:hypothetical protein